MGTRERRATARDEVRAAVPKMLESMPDGARYSELIDLLQAALPHVNRNTLSGAMFEFSQQPPAEVLKPSRGHYIHRKFARSASSEEPEPDARAAVPGAAKVREQDFYQPFADWLVNEMEECTRAIPLGGNLFKDKWGTPDVIGVRRPRDSDILKFTIEVVSAEVKTDGSQLITAFGQACAYRLFSHKSYLVIPVSSPEEDVARLDVLARIFEIGLVLFDAASATTPNFSIRVRPSKHEPDGFYVNRCLKLVESQLFG